MILFIDNYDSFTYNLVQFCGSVNPDIKVVRNDEITVDEIKKLAPSHIILSPGPGYPKDAGICEEVIKELAGQFPILGICLGHQAICEVYGATIAHAIKLMHGKKSDIIVDTDKKIFNGLPKVVEGARYHSLIAKRDTVPDTLEVIAGDRDGASSISFLTSAGRAAGRSILLTTGRTSSPLSTARYVFASVWASMPCEASTTSTAPSQADKLRETS